MGEAVYQRSGGGRHRQRLPDRRSAQRDTRSEPGDAGGGERYRCGSAARHGRRVRGYGAVALGKPMGRAGAQRDGRRGNPGRRHALAGQPHPADAAHRLRNALPDDAGARLSL